MRKKQYFTITRVCREDLAEIFGEKANELSNDEMEWLASKMADDYIEQLYWTQIEILGQYAIDRMEERKGTK